MSQDRGPADPADDRGTGIGPAGPSPANEGAIAGGGPMSPAEEDTLSATRPTSASAAFIDG